MIVPWQFEKKGKQMEVAVDGRLTVNDPELAVRAALDGVGVLYTALGYAASEIKRGGWSLIGGLAVTLRHNLPVLSEPATGGDTTAGLHRVPAREPSSALRRAT
jgi:DNA-binding transcriptional LysR family regulator